MFNYGFELAVNFAQSVLSDRVFLGILRRQIFSQTQYSNCVHCLLL